TIISALKQTGDYGGLFAAVMIVFLPTFILYLLLSEKIIAGVTGGGVKG
ncbi:MAG: carbohydrate ABC transporter permease, partial [Lachnospiraceae bacterium]|nr:carbohydrate ABC transporter permease [Lachnospiraceae bacterium]